MELCNKRSSNVDWKPIGAGCALANKLKKLVAGTWIVQYIITGYIYCLQESSSLNPGQFFSLADLLSCPRSAWIHRHGEEKIATPSSNIFSNLYSNTRDAEASMGGKSESGLAKETARERPTYTPSFVILSSIDRSLARRSTRDGPCMRGAWPAHRQVILGYQSYHSHRHVSLALFSSRTSSSFRSSSPSLAANSMPHVTACMVHRLVYIYICS